MSTALGVAAAGLVTVTAAPASAKTIKACVNKKSGDMVLLKKKKCKKGWKKIKWNAQGPAGATGPAGPAGPQLSVRDKNGTVLGSFMGYYDYGPNPEVMVLTGGGLYNYSTDGRVSRAGQVTYLAWDCTGAVYLPAYDATSTQNYLSTVGSAGRAVERTTDPTYGPTQAFALTSATVPIAVDTPIYSRNSEGTCGVYDSTFQGTLIAYQPVAAPPDGVGPLTIG